jgi:hypothetical protein
VRVAAVVGDLLTYSRIESMASGAGASLARVDAPAELPPPSEVDVVVVDWGSRRPEWADQLDAWRRRPGDARLILFGPHVDLEAHAAARAAGLGPMWARSRLMRDLPALIG